MSYLRPMGDGPITSPGQDDAPSGQVLVPGDVPVKRVPCDQMPDDSPWKQPGQPCAPQTGGWFDYVKGLLVDAAKGAATGPATAPSDPASPPWALILGGAALGAYLIYRKRK